LEVSGWRLEEVLSVQPAKAGNWKDCSASAPLHPGGMLQWIEECHTCQVTEEPEKAAEKAQ